MPGYASYTEEQAQRALPVDSYRRLLGSGDFWETTAENWDSEFLAVFLMVVLTIFLREKNSSQSKPVHGSHKQTGK